MPLWPELRAELGALFAIAVSGMNCSADTHVIQGYRDTEAIVDTHFLQTTEADFAGAAETGNSEQIALEGQCQGQSKAHGAEL